MYQLENSLTVFGDDSLCFPEFPFHQVIEWVDHCRAFKDYILDIKGPGGNSRYYPDEPSFSSCKNFFDEAKEAPVEVRLEVFKRILAQKSPVFRYFFVEKFGNSLEDWHASKLRYTRSVAVNSMVGHVFGIGKLCSHFPPISSEFPLA